MYNDTYPEEQAFGELPIADIEHLLTTEEANVIVERDDETLLETEPESVRISRPRAIRNHTERQENTITYKFHVSMVVPIDQSGG